MLPSDSANNLTKDGIDNVVGGLQSAREIVDEWDLKVFELLGQPLPYRGLATGSHTTGYFLDETPAPNTRM